MWILSSELYRSAQEAGCWTPESAPHLHVAESNPKLWCIVSGKPRLAPSSDRVWRTRPWSALLFGAVISNPCHSNHFEEWLRSSLLASPVRDTLLPESDLAETTNEISSPQSSESQMELGLMLCFLRTSPGLRKNSDMSPASCFKGGGILNGELSGRPMLEPLTAGSDGSAWPTVNTSPDAPNGGLNRGGGCLRNRTTDQCLGRRAETFWPTASARDHKDTSGMATEGTNPDGSHRDRLDQLPRAATNWATPRASDPKCGSADLPQCTGRDLSRDATNWGTWPTARAEDSESCGNHPGATDSLTGAVRNWATPRVTTNGGIPAPDVTGKGSRLEDQAGTWQTVTAQDANGRDRQTQRDGSMTLSLLGEASQFSLPVPVIPGGPVFSADDPGLPPLSLYRQWLCGLLGVKYSDDLAWRLNPAFTNWLMGWEPTWTSLIPLSRPAPINSASLETASAVIKPHGLSTNS